MANTSLPLIKCLVSIAVTAVAVLPRMPLDPPWSVGGHLSHRFRQLLLVLCGFRIFKFVFGDSVEVVPSDLAAGLVVFIYGFESSLISFLTLLTPYLLRVWLCDRINIPGGGGRGKGLEVWVLVVASLCFAGVSLELLGFGTDIFFLKKVGDCLTFFPVTRTMALYNSVTNPGGRYPGRGMVLPQVILIVEWYSLFTHGTDALSKFLHMVGLMDDDVYWSSVLKSLREHNLFASLIRIMCHSIFLNVLDETYQFRHTTSSGVSQSDDAANDGHTTADTSGSTGGSFTEEEGRFIEEITDSSPSGQEIVRLVKA